MSGIDEGSEKKANELEEEAWKRARDGGMPKLAEIYAAQGVEYLTPEHAWVAADNFTNALEFIANDASNNAEEKRIEWLVLRGDARYLRQWYDLAVEDYENALNKMRSLPRVRQALLECGTADVEEKIKTTAREGVSEYPELAKYLGNSSSLTKKEDDK